MVYNMILALQILNVSIKSAQNLNTKMQFVKTVPLSRFGIIMSQASPASCIQQYHLFD